MACPTTSRAPASKGRCVTTRRDSLSLQVMLANMLLLATCFSSTPPGAHNALARMRDSIDCSWMIASACSPAPLVLPLCCPDGALQLASNFAKGRHSQKAGHVLPTCLLCVTTACGAVCVSMLHNGGRPQRVRSPSSARHAPMHCSRWCPSEARKPRPTHRCRWICFNGAKRESKARPALRFAAGRTTGGHAAPHVTVRFVP